MTATVSTATAVAESTSASPPASGPAPTTLVELSALAESAATVREAAALLRTRIAPLRVVVVDATDMQHETPALTGERWSLFLAASDGHCWTVTRDTSQVAGLYLCPRS